MPRRVNPHKFLRAFIAKHGTQRAAADALGVTQQDLSDVVRGRRDITERMAGLIGLDVATVYTTRKPVDNQSVVV